MSIRTLLQTGLVATMAILAADGATAEAGHRSRYSRQRVDVDIDSLKSELWYGRSGPELHVRYEVEIEDASPYDAFDLVLHVTERGRRVTDHHGRPITFILPLQYPSDVDDDEIEFRDRVVLRLIGGRIHNAKRLRLHAEVVRRGTQRALDHKDTSVRYRHGRGHRRGRFALDIRVGYSR